MLLDERTLPKRHVFSGLKNLSNDESTGGTGIRGAPGATASDCNMSCTSGAPSDACNAKKRTERNPYRFRKKIESIGDFDDSHQSLKYIVYRVPEPQNYQEAGSQHPRSPSITFHNYIN